MSTATRDAILAFLDGVHYGVNLTMLIQSLPDHSPDDLKNATRALYDERAINRVSVLGTNERYYYVFYSIYVHTTMVHRADERGPLLTIEEATAVLEEAGWRAEPEEVTERRAAERIGIMDVIDRWKLGFRLSRIIEIVGGARNRKLTHADADAVVTLIRDHLRGQE